MPLPLEISSKIAELQEQGWQLQFTTDEPRLSEAVELYGELGYEVRVEPACTELPLLECTTCYDRFCDRYRTIFIRRSRND